MATPWRGGVLRTHVARTLSLFLLFARWTQLVNPQELAPHLRTSQEVVCSNIDIRNSVANFNKLENCTIVEGLVQILLIDNATSKDYEKLSFPKLREITGYFLLFRAVGMLSIGKLFPNLAVIRGNVLFHNYAFVVYEMHQLQEIGLGNLTDILRGSVRVEKNSNLCYVDTIDWDRIAKEGRGGHFIKQNKGKDQCPNSCPEHMMCPLGTRSGSSRDRPARLCWNSHICQKVCAPECEHQNRTCYGHPSQCCHPQCLGGCSGPAVTDCVSCLNVMYNGRCHSKCPPNTYEHMGRRCITEQECRKMTTKLPRNPQDPVIYWKPFHKQCLTECPPGYTEDTGDRHVCVKCKDRCPKVCPGSVVDNVAAAQNLHGCTLINGSLEILIQGGGNVIQELEKNLNVIEEITGYLKVARAFPLISLNFLKNLRIIHGQMSDKSEYSFIVLDNQNLQELFDWKHRPHKLQIKGGKIFFHFNSKLCPSKIQELKQFADVRDWDDRDVSPSSNGDRVACNVTNMNLTVWKVSSEMVVVLWENFKKTLVDPRSLLGYVIYYREAPYRNITIFDGRDACGADVWKVVDVEAESEESDSQWQIIPHLKPFTQYALYIRTYTLAMASQGAQSPIIYFTTEPDTPTSPVNVRSRPTSFSEIVISWHPPKKPNGNVTHYLVEAIEKTDSSDIINQRNYCMEPLSLPDPKKRDKVETNVESVSFSNGTQPSVPSSTATTKPGDCCPCAKDKPQLEEEEEEVAFQIHFEDFLHNNVYVKNPQAANDTRKRRATGYTSKPQAASYSMARELASMAKNTVLTSSQEAKPVIDGSTTSSPSEIINSTEEPNAPFRFKEIVHNQQFLKMAKLRHFTEYAIEVQACHDSNPDPMKPRCSLKAIASVRTLPLGGADDIETGTIHIMTDNATIRGVGIRWEEPKDPNGLIVSYDIEYRRVNDEDHKSPLCITWLQYQQRKGYLLSHLASGNYSLRLRATSLAGPGNWTNPVYFQILDARDGVTSEVIIAVVVSVSVAIGFLLFLVAWIVVRKKYGPGVPDGVLYASVNPEYMSAVYEPDDWEVGREKIMLIRELGQGSFGMVYEGEAKEIHDKPLVKCAVKTVNESASLRERIEFLQEASVMKTFNCHHVVKLLGVVSKGHPTLVIMELMANGDLKSYLRSHRPDSEEFPGCQPPTLKRILQMAIEIGDGMAYLAAKKFVHRDLAARNCMVAEDLTVKIGDFGMTRDIYETDYYRKGGKGLLPVRWMAPESLKDGVFTSQSDVWSYGVVLWEMATLASQPYQGLSNEQVLKYVIHGGIMEKPENCPEKLYALMKLCWEENPKARPTFIELIEILLPDVSSRFKEVSFYFNQRQETCPQEAEEHVTPSTPLKSSSHVDDSSFASHDNSDDESEVMHYFPTVTRVPDDKGNSDQQHDCENDAECALDEMQCCDESRGLGIRTSNGSKGMSTTSSDGSKGSKVSTVSNGSLANGHIPFQTSRTTVC